MLKVVGSARPPNKGMKLTKPERNGALQLIPGVVRTGLEATRRKTMTRFSAVLAVGCLLLGPPCAKTADDLPPVHQNPDQASPRLICDKLPILLHGSRPELVRPDNLRRCLTKRALAKFSAEASPRPMSGRSSLPVIYSVSASGRVAPGLAFWDQCLGSTLPVDPATTACLQLGLSEWRYAADVESCPIQYYSQTDFYEVAVVPWDAEPQVAANGRQSACS
jgi:hypothetical protein